MIAATSLQPPHDPAGTDSHDWSGKQPTGKAHGPGVQLAPDEMRGNKPGADFKRDIEEIKCRIRAEVVLGGAPLGAGVLGMAVFLQR